MQIPPSVLLLHTRLPSFVVVDDSLVGGVTGFPCVFSEDFSGSDSNFFSIQLLHLGEAVYQRRTRIQYDPGFSFAQ